MGEERANLKPSLQQSAYSCANAAAEPGSSHISANPWVTAHPRYHAFAPLVNPSPSQLGENTFPAGAAYNAGIAFPNGPGHYIWVPEVAAGPMDQFANTNSQYLDPSFSTTGPYAGGIIGNGHGGQLQANGFNAHTNTAGAFSNASYAFNNGSSYGGQYAANSFGTHVSAAGAFSNPSFGVDDGKSYGGQYAANGFGTQVSAASAFPNASYAVANGDSYGGRFAANGLGPQATTAAGLPTAFNVVDDNATPRGPAQVAPARHTCAKCNRSFKRKYDLERHDKIHQPDSKNFRCVAAGCEYSSYRKDKLDDHVKHRHAVTASAST